MFSTSFGKKDLPHTTTMWNSTKIHIFTLKVYLYFSLFLVVEDGISYLLLKNIAESILLIYKPITEIRIFSVNQKLWLLTVLHLYYYKNNFKVKVMCIGISSELDHSSTALNNILKNISFKGTLKVRKMFSCLSTFQIKQVFTNNSFWTVPKEASDKMPLVTFLGGIMNRLNHTFSSTHASATVA